MKKYADKKRAEVNEYKVGNLVMLSTKDLKYQMVGRRTKKLIESVTNFIQSYLHQIFNDSHGLKTSLKPLKRAFY